MTKINFGSSRTDGEEANQTTRNLLSFKKNIIFLLGRGIFFSQ